VIAQNKQEKFNVTGVVVDALGNPVNGVQLSVLYTRISSKTNKKGEFTLKKVQADDSIRVIIDKNDFAQFLVGDHRKINLAIVENMLNVAFENGDVAFSTIKPFTDDEDFRYGNTITVKMIQRNNFRTLEEVIQNMIPAATITGNGTGVRLRGGSSSIYSSDGALIIVNGTEMSFSEANTSINALNIESIDVDKEGVAYGARGVGGAIKIKTQ
jgi:hypothetical protein